MDQHDHHFRIKSSGSHAVPASEVFRYLKHVCRFEHFIDTVSRFPEITGRKFDLIGAYIAWRGRDITVPVLDLFTFWSRKHAGGEVAAQNACLATINELALAARTPSKEFYHCVLLGHPSVDASSRCCRLLDASLLLW
jgi:hypothetical protein